ncbi:MAG: OmpA family protein [Firmicutes bacterium]|jgi:chemotaxis protein MotB|nr:OmpA family protein [Bacillota bacterium]
MRRRLQEEEEQGGAPGWMVSYADLTQLLLTFFILLFALSSIDAHKFRQAVISLQGALGVLPSGTGVLDVGDVPPTPRSFRPDEYGAGEEAAMEMVRDAFQSYLSSQALTGSVHLELTERGLVVSFMDKVLFDVGDAQLREEAHEVLKEVAVILENIPNDVRIEGHTCDLPIRTSRFPSNWELSTSRACTVLRYFVEETSLEPERFSAMGYGEYRPKMANVNEVSRSLNRRVDVVILRDREKLVIPESVD